ncbi:hypothetical protein NG799_04565 [Laspinema sp. D1]|uniref:Transposase n=1 Tax=Laspinema palackyanum D2a TaxID=2953684 RepID=A0ABT2MLI0_9CYAN|nr:hypothetical protein [Laspinema sp. D2b]MCT7965606.1 hypothetical protein [Laspinema sp. D2a]
MIGVQGLAIALGKSRVLLHFLGKKASILPRKWDSQRCTDGLGIVADGFYLTTIK